VSLAVDDQNRFGSELRWWRTQRHLSQLDLSLLADVSARHLSFLETGRSKPSREMVVHLCEHLDVPLAQRNEVLNAAGFAPAYSSFDLDDPAMGPVRDAIDAVLSTHQPFPAIVVDRHWNLVSANESALVLLGDVAPELLEPTINVVRVSMHPGGLQPRIENFGEYAGHMLDRLRRQHQRTGDPVLADLLAEATEYVDAAGGPVHAINASQVVLPMVVRWNGVRLSVFSTIAVFGAPYDVTVEDLAIEAFHPADAATRDVFRSWSS
jgi:transcriptional regulator with XRE-family HTH domain